VSNRDAGTDDRRRKGTNGAGLEKGDQGTNAREETSRRKVGGGSEREAGWN